MSLIWLFLIELDFMLGAVNKDKSYKLNVVGFFFFFLGISIDELIFIIKYLKD